MAFKFYFQLQFLLLNRWWRTIGLAPAMGHVLGVGLFILGSVVLYRETEWASWIYLFFAAGVLARAAGHRRNQFLRRIFPHRDYYRLRILENGLLILPFLVFMATQGAWSFAAGLLGLGLILALIPPPAIRQIRIPSPFFRYPFEFSLGFRRSYGIYMLAVFLVFMAIRVDNYHLGTFALLMILLTCLSYYGQPEPIYFVWMYARTPRDFLRHKVGVSWGYLCLALAPFLLALILYDPAQWYIPLILPLGGMAAMAAVILTKYAAYPRPMNVAQGVLLALGLSFPPLLLFVVPYFYKKSIRSLHTYLT